MASLRTCAVTGVGGAIQTPSNGIGPPGGWADINARVVASEEERGGFFDTMTTDALMSGLTVVVVVTANSCRACSSWVLTVVLIRSTLTAFKLRLPQLAQILVSQFSDHFSNTHYYIYHSTIRHSPSRHAIHQNVLSLFLSCHPMNRRIWMTSYLHFCWLKRLGNFAGSFSSIPQCSISFYL